MKNKIKKFAHLKIYLKIFYFSSFLSCLPYVLTKNEKWFPNFQQIRQILFFLLSILSFSSKKNIFGSKFLNIWNSFFMKRCGKQLKPQIYVIEGNLCLFWTKQKKTLFLGQKIAKCCEAKNKIDLFQSFVGQYWR